MVTSIGADGFAERAARELRATGEQVRKRTPETTTPSQLTARETQISQLAGDGLSNPEIAAQLLMSIIVSRSRWASMRCCKSVTSGSRELVVLSSPSR
jgi:FixJ family two-component response regulator